MEINEDDLERVAVIKEKMEKVCEGAAVSDIIIAMQVLCIEITGSTLIDDYPDLTQQEMTYGISRCLEAYVETAVVMGPILQKHY